LILICLNADLEGQSGRDQASLCHEALRELVLETNEFVTLLGDVKTNGQATPGLIQQRLPLIKLADEEALVDKIIQEAAKTADDNGRTNDAVLLCHIAGEYDSVVRLLNRALSEALSVDLGQEPLRLEPLRQGVVRGPQTQLPTLDSSSTLSMLATDDPIELAGRVMTLYDQNALWWQNVARVNRDALGVLSSLNAAKKTVEAGRYMEALDVSLYLVPLQSSVPAY
jgi:nuclear pore complex protein Nup93